MSLTVGDLLAKVPEGQSRNFVVESEGEVEYHFLEVAYNWEYGGGISWNNRPSLMEKPRLSFRGVPGIGLENLVEPDLTYDGPAAELVDFHNSGSAAFIISDRLLDVFEFVDPGSIEIRKVTIQAKDGRVPFSMVMPLRVLEAIDAGRCEVNIVAKQLGPQWIRRISFPKGVVIRKDIDAAIHNFAELDMSLWLWSRELFEKAKSAGVKGVVLRTPGVAASRQIDQI
ncbi:imm11 family protein [Aurantiacibacter flavus]|uniref:DUF1629 domain-containing protein n=1 Tax=Aurantiacibacter flavus TaxID=3145232 RepID=A0ABV0CSL0_9SPHN